MMRSADTDHVSGWPTSSAVVVVGDGAVGGGGGGGGMKSGY